MEIMSYVVQGGLTHQDSMGSKETLYTGSVQYMSAGTGVRHSEFNISGKDSLRILQLWINPNQKGLKPNYGSRLYQPEDRLNKLLHVVSGDDKAFPETIVINQDANIFVSQIELTQTVSYEVKAGRQVYLVCIEGDLGISGQVSLTERDAVEISGPSELVFSNEKPQGKLAHFLMIEMAA